MKMNTSYFGFLLIFYVAISSCSDPKLLTVEEQKLVINRIANKPVTYFEKDTKNAKITKAATRKLNGNLYGEVIEFSDKGFPTEMYFINKSGKRVANNTFFDSSGKVDEHIYWVENEEASFHFSKENGEDSIQGHPWAIFYSKYFRPGDTIYFHINTVLIPYCKSYVAFRSADNHKPLLQFKSDLREFTCKIPSSVNDTTKHEYMIRVNINRNNGDNWLSDSLKLIVTPRS